MRDGTAASQVTSVISGNSRHSLRQLYPPSLLRNRSPYFVPASRIRIRRVGPYRPDRRVRLNREGRIDPSRAAIPIVTGEALGISSFAGVGGALAAVALVAPCGRRWPLILSGVISLASFGLLHGHVTATGSARARLVALGQRHPRAEINTRHMLFRIPQLIVDISAGMTLEPGAGFARSLRTSCEATVYGYVLILSALMILTE
jgi:hypothetical protein